MIIPSGNDTKFSGDERGVGVLLTPQTWAELADLLAHGVPTKNQALHLNSGDKVYVSDAARRRADAAKDDYKRRHAV